MYHTEMEKDIMEEILFYEMITRCKLSGIENGKFWRLVQCSVTFCEELYNFSFIQRKLELKFHSIFPSVGNIRI